MNRKTILFPLLLLGLLACRPPSPQPATTATPPNTVKNTAPDADHEKVQGYTLPGLDHGLSQSPINIDTRSLEKEGEHKVTVRFKDEAKKVENLGHTVQLSFQEGSTISVDDLTFEFKQCHFHTPSEHLLDGLTFPMEMHIVNMMPSQDEGAEPQYLVIGVLFKAGKENRFIAEFLDSIPSEEHASQKLEAGQVKLMHLFDEVPPEEKGHHYHYMGSLTTPPYSETVRWYIHKHIFEASAEQIQTINKLEGNNARHVQALYGRSVSAK